MRIIDAFEASRLLPMKGLMESLREFLIEGCEVPPRHHHTIAVPGQPEATLLLMPSWKEKSGDGGYLGVKLVTVFPGNSARGFPALTSVYLLFDSGTGARSWRQSTGTQSLFEERWQRRRWRHPISRAKMQSISWSWVPDASPVFCPRRMQPFGTSAGSECGTSILKTLREW